MKLHLVGLPDLVINELKIPFLWTGEGWTKKSQIYPQVCKIQAADKGNNGSGGIAQCRTPEGTCRNPKAFFYWNLSAQGLKGGPEHSPETPVSPSSVSSLRPWHSFLLHFKPNFSAPLPVWVTAQLINETLLNMHALNWKTIMAPGKLHSIRQLPVFLKPLCK